MYTRVVPRYRGTQAAVAAREREPASPGPEKPQQRPLLHQKQSAEEILRQAHANSIAGVLGQIAQVAAHAFEIFNELRDQNERVSKRLEKISDRVQVVTAVLDGDTSALARVPPVAVSDAVLVVPELSAIGRRPRSKAQQEAYEKCDPLPAFELFEEFCSDVSECRKKFSHPEFVREDWMKRETFCLQQAAVLREERRRQRREQKKPLVPPSTDTPTTTNQCDAPTAEDAARAELAELDSDRLTAQQKTKFLGIRSWKERS
ncbi:hypothetical protein ATCC90586_003134 [Pythium insidiosum]|nr:hypothetical protein ATCC90586_003134 [Pythium insidiosum]